ncbi:DUF3107 domain-containing protein [Schaalia georgiae]|nr:DUF3107 domain-containing protein [Schaalia georgiae]
MNIVIGVRDSARELPLEIDIDEAALVRTIEQAIASGGVVSLTDAKGDRVLVPAAAIAYVQIARKSDRRVGFAVS